MSFLQSADAVDRVSFSKSDHVTGILLASNDFRPITYETALFTKTLESVKPVVLNFQLQCLKKPSR